MCSANFLTFGESALGRALALALSELTCIFAFGCFLSLEVTFICIRFILVAELDPGAPCVPELSSGELRDTATCAGGSVVNCASGTVAAVIGGGRDAAGRLHRRIVPF